MGAHQLDRGLLVAQQLEAGRRALQAASPDRHHLLAYSCFRFLKGPLLRIVTMYDRDGEALHTIR